MSDLAATPLRTSAADLSENEAVVSLVRRAGKEPGLRQILDALPTAIYATDAEGRITLFNRACVAFSGRTPTLGSDHWCVTWKLYHPDGRPMPHDECPMAIALKEGRAVRGVEAIAERPDGTRIWFEPYPTPLFDEAGNVIGGINMLVDITERRKNEHANATLAAIVESSDDAIISKNLDSIITSWNRGAERMFGYTAAEAIGRSVTMLMPPDRVSEEPGILTRLRAGERIDHYETVRRRKDGTLLDISLTVSPIRDRQGRIIGASKVARDITHRKQAERDLREGEERYRQLLALMPAAVYSCDQSGLITYYNERAAQLWGRSPRPGDTDERFCGSEQMILPDGRPLPHEQCPMAVALREGRAFRDQEVTIRRPDGSLVPVLVNIDPILDEQGEVVGAINAFHDVSAVKQAEAARRESEERFRLLADSSPALIWVNGATGCEYVNKTYLAFLGVDLIAVRGDSWAAFVHPQDRESYLSAYRKAMRDRAEFDAEFRFRRADGDYRWMRSTGRPRFGPDGGFVGYAGVTVDITERKQQEAHAALLTAELSHRVKNTLASIDAIASQSMRHAGSLEQFAESFRERLRAMARSHGLLTRSNWEGAPLREVVEAELLSRVGSPEHARIEGPPVMLPPRALLSVHMALHELCTNAAKYGALSTPKGRVSVQWRMLGQNGDRQLELDWTERGGPRVAPPQRKGFGTTLLGQVIEYELEGETRLDFDMGGVRCQMLIPWDTAGPYSE